MEDLLNVLRSALVVLAQLMSEYRGFASVCFLLVVLIFVARTWPDRAVRVFLGTGVRVPSRNIHQLRADLADIAADGGRQALRVMTQQQLKIEEIRHERERVKNLVRAGPLLVKEVGEALKAVEVEYERHLRLVKSEQAKEVLRRSAEKSINDILVSVNTTPGKTPAFALPDKAATPAFALPDKEEGVVEAGQI